MGKPTTIAEHESAIKALAPKTHAEIAAACASVLAADAAVKAEHGCTYDLMNAIDGARLRIGAAIATLPWGRAPDGFFVTNRRLTWDGDRALAIFRHRVEVAAVDVTRNGYMSRLRIADPAMARADRETARAKARKSLATYHAALDAVAGKLAADHGAFRRLAVAVETTEEVTVPEWLGFVAGQEGGRLGDAPAVGARGALRRAAKATPALAGIVPDLRALTLARWASRCANDNHIEPSAYTAHEAERAARDAASAAKAAGPGWRERALAIIRDARA